MAHFDNELDAALSGDEPVSDEDEFGVQRHWVDFGENAASFLNDRGVSQDDFNDGEIVVGMTWDAKRRCFDFGVPGSLGILAWRQGRWQSDVWDLT